jgi:hypothetical protein
MSIVSHPSFIAWLDRGTAERVVAECGRPLLRESSIAGHYAATYYCLKRSKIIHTLFRQNVDNSIDDVSPQGVVWGHYGSLEEFMTILQRGAPPLLTQIAPSLVRLLPAVVASRAIEEDPKE